MERALQYGVVLTIATLTTLCFKVFYLNPLLFGSPYKTYPAHTVVAKPGEFTPSFMDYLKSITMLDVLQSLLAGVIICFVIWMVEQAVRLIKRKIAK